jgi:D-alanine-D-alanine ligase-like ATP-grasp enzyme
VNFIDGGLKDEKNIMVEEFINGKMASIHCVPTFRGDELYVFPISNKFGRSADSAEADFSLDEKKKMANLAKVLHKNLGAKHYLKSDFILNPHGKVYLLEVESIPDLKPDSAFSQACDSVGAKMEYVIEHILDQSIN